MPISYQTGQYDAKWVDKLCIQNYRIGAVMTEMYSHAEHLQKTTEVKTRGYDDSCVENCCTGVLEANLNSNVIGVAHIGGFQGSPSQQAAQGPHAEYGRSVDDMTGVFAVVKFISSGVIHMRRYQRRLVPACDQRMLLICIPIFARICLLTLSGEVHPIQNVVEESKITIKDSWDHPDIGCFRPGQCIPDGPVIVPGSSWLYLCSQAPLGVGTQLRAYGIPNNR
jgi:hypothetical protein